MDLRPLCKDTTCRNRAVSRGWCESHKKNNSTYYKEYDTFSRNKETQKIYSSSRWQNLRKHMRQKNPLCMKYEASRIIKAGAMSDHCLPAQQHPEYVYDEDNIFTLCQSCHRVVTIMEQKNNYFINVPLEKVIFIKYGIKREIQK